MGYINKKNKVGAVAENAAPYLQEGELGIDLNAANGDVGRVYVGTGSQNVALAKKADVDLLNTLKAPLESPALTGVPTGPTAAVGTDTTQLATTEYVNAEIANDTYSKEQLDLGQLDHRYYTEAELDAGQLDNRYYTEAEIDALLATQNEASEIGYSNTVSGLVATTVQAALDEVEGRVDTVETDISVSNLTRADKYLAAQNIAAMSYDVDGNLSKIQYNNATDVDYEVFGYMSGNLSTIQHYVGSVLKGTTTLSYTSGNLVSARFVGV